MSRREGTLSLVDRLDRARRISVTFGRVYLSLRALRRREQAGASPQAMARRWERQHRRNAEEIYELAISLHGLILKGCQFLSARADVLPRPYTEALGRLQDRVPPRPFETVRRVVEHELGAPLDEVFSSFAKLPVASASLAQVHEAVLRNGRRVAVKVQYPEIATLVRSDLANLRVLFRAVAFLERDFDLMPLIDELGETVPRELDFRQEGRNAERVAAALGERGDVCVPEILWPYTTRRVLTMEFLDGIKVTDRAALLRADVDPAWVARTLVEVYCEQVLVHGFFHADPHPGNLFVLPGPEGPKLALVDFGLAKELPPRFREGVLDFAAALLLGKSEKMGRALVELGFETRDGRAAALHEIADLLLRAGQEIRDAGRVDPELVARLRKEIPEEIRANPVVRIPHHLVLVGRALALLLGVNASLAERVDFLRAVAPYALGPRPAAPA